MNLHQIKTGHEDFLAFLTLRYQNLGPWEWHDDHPDYNSRAYRIHMPSGERDRLAAIHQRWLAAGANPRSASRFY